MPFSVASAKYFSRPSSKDLRLAILVSGSSSDSRRARPETAVGQVGDEEGDRISEGAPGQHFAEAEMAERVLDKEIGRGDDDRHGRHEWRK